MSTHTGQNAAKTLVMPESAVPLFEAPNGKLHVNYYNPAESEFDRLAIAEFLRRNIGAFGELLDELGMDPEGAGRIIGGLEK